MSKNIYLYKDGRLVSFGDNSFMKTVLYNDIVKINGHKRFFSTIKMIKFENGSHTITDITNQFLES